MLKLLIDESPIDFEITKFPDGTSQVWKLQDTDDSFYENDPVILWLFEHEGELMHVLQLAQLVQKHFGLPDCTLRVPYLPYGRQDKAVNNKLSFALTTFKDVLYNANITRIETFDAHSNTDMVYSTAPTEFHKAIFSHDVVCFPDRGAAVRYGVGEAFGNAPIIHFEKVRDQLTGNITGLKMIGDADLSGKSVLIVDDICDGGMTFIKVAEALRVQNLASIDLAVSHGLFSKGKQVLHDAGINKIFTTNSLLRNKEGFKVW